MKGRLSLDEPISRLRGIGSSRAERLAGLGVRTIEDLLRRAPRAYEDRGGVLTIAEARAREPGSMVAVGGTITRASLHRFRGRSHFRAVLEDETAKIEIFWFHAGRLSSGLKKDSGLAVSGRISEKKTLLHPEFAPWRKGEEFPARLLGIRPVYSLAEGITQRLIRDLTAQALDQIESPRDPLSPDLLRETGVVSLDDAFQFAHAPSSLEEGRKGQERLLFEEIYALELAMARRAAIREARDANAARPAENAAMRFLESLPFKPSASQRSAALDLVRDLDAASRTERLLAGEVGSGKTVVALAAAFEAAERGMQSALLAPTALLAQQHLRSALEFFPRAVERVALLTGSMAADEARRTRGRLADGRVDLIIGTSALLSEKTRFRKLGLVMVDEQHRFGVEQRDSLARKGEDVRVVGISATPIPRTLALLAYPGWDVSLLEGRPDSRGPVTTRVLELRDRERALAWIADRVRSDMQAILIRPRIEGEKEGAVAFHEELHGGAFAGIEIGLVHGALSADAREKALAQFASGRMRALIATTIVEVGIDVPGASILWIEGAEMLGLAQLHQLRGRIARRGQKGYCFVVPSEECPPAALARLATFRDVQDGLRLAEIDLADRGPGELLGIRQSGAFSFGAARGFADDPEALGALLEKARTAARIAASREVRMAGEPSQCDPQPSHSS
jgi:ATP-dependent DNA helicase RecG